MSPTASPAAQPANGAREAGRLRADPRLTAYLVAGFGGLVAAIVTGQSELAALGAPFLALAAIGLAGRRPFRVQAEITLDSHRLIEGDVVAGVLSLAWDGEAELDVVLSGSHGVAPEDPMPVTGWSLPAGHGPVELPFRLRATAWGTHELGTVWVRARRPGALIMREYTPAAAPAIRVLPRPTRLVQLLRPAEPRAVAGVHTSRLRGHGTDFAELRPYVPGDRLRDLSWATSARLGQPWVVVHHPERTGTVLLLIDALFGTGPRGKEALARKARAAWAVASSHLKAQDRVGLLAKGRSVAWLPPRGGRRARWLLLEELLGVGGAAEDLRPPRLRGGRVFVPPDALVIGISGLGSPRFARDLLHYRRAGHATVALVIDTSDMLPSRDPIDIAASRLWRTQRETERLALESAGVPTAVVGGEHGVGPAISALQRRLAALRANRAAVVKR